MEADKKIAEAAARLEAEVFSYEFYLLCNDFHVHCLLNLKWKELVREKNSV